MKVKINKKLGILLLILLLGGVAIATYVAQQPQDIRQRAACVAESGNCLWDPVPGAVKYHYIITLTEEGTTVKEGDVDAPTTSVTFTPVPGQSFTCNVFAINDCNSEGEAGVGIQQCVANDTPTPTLPATPTPTAVPTVTPVPSEGPTPTLTPTVAPPTSTPNPTVSQAPIVTSTPTPIVIVGTSPTPTLTITPTLAPSGSHSMNIGLALGAIIAFLGVVFFFAM